MRRSGARPLAVLAAVTMTAGNAAALRQLADRPHSAVRLLAWSSVGQAGYLLVPLAAAAPDAGSDPARALSSAGATVAYLLMYAAVNLGAFAVVAHVSRTSRANRLEDYRGLYAAHPLAALALGFFLLCLAGLPPGVIGLFAKVAIFSTAVQNGLGWLAVDHGRERGDRAVLLPPVDGARLPSAGGGCRGGGDEAGHEDRGRRDREPGAAPVRIAAPLSAAIALTAAVGIVLSVDPDLVLTFAAEGLR